MLKTFQSEITKLRLPAEFMASITQWYTPIAQALVEQYTEKQSTLLVNVNGSQGSGKTTLSVFLRLLLEQQFGLHTVDISLDDFYLTQSQRLKLAKDIHPLLATRGVPGTHDIELASGCMQSMLQQQPCTLPQFDKAIDDRADSSQWKPIKKPVDIILFEGWCVGAPIQTSAELENPVNSLEANEDTDGIWRNYVNDALTLYHHQLFSLGDYFVFLQIPDFDLVYEWRGLQEDKLALDKSSDQAVMDQQQVRRFIQHYERITRHCLKQLPTTADMIIELNSDHDIVSLRNR